MKIGAAARFGKGFTLVELLVVLAILSILIALLFSALKSSRETASGSQCISNLRALCGANLRYASEHEGRFCPAQDKSNRIRWHGERATIHARFAPEKGPLAPYLGRESRVKICPSFRDAIEGEESFEEGSGGYGYNAVYIGGTPRNKWIGAVVLNIPIPSATVMFVDTAFSRQSGIQEYPFAEPWQWIAPNGRLSGPLSPSVHFRHQGHAHVAWCDGHVSTEKPTRLGKKNFYGGDDEKNQIGWFGPEENNGYWNPEWQSAE